MLIPVLDLDNVTIMQEIAKVKEETEEIVAAFADKESKERIMEECFDLIQASFNLLYMVGTDEEIDTACSSHFIKMRDRKYEFMKMLIIKASSPYER